MDVVAIVVRIVLVLLVALGFYMLGKRHEKAHQQYVLHGIFYIARSTLKTSTEASYSMLYAAALNFRQTMHLAKVAEDEHRYHLARNWNAEIEAIMRMMETNGYVPKDE